MNEIISILKESSASDYLIRQTTTTSQEAFFIGQKLDMGRAKEVTHTRVTVFVDSEDKKFRGSATKEIHPTATAEEIRKEIEKAIFAASFVKNPWYPLAEEATAKEAEADVNLSEELVRITKAMQAVKTGENERVNSYEIFANKKLKRVVNSKGVDVTMSGFECEVEVVINTSRDGHEIELIKDMKFANKPSDEITAEVEAMFVNGKARLEAVPTKQNEHATVLLTGDDVPKFFEYYLANASASLQYMGVGKAKLEEKITGDDADGLTISGKAVLEGSTKNGRFDEDGKAVKDVTFYENGVCKAFLGSLQHAYYLGIKDITSVNNAVVAGGSMNLADMKKLPHVEITDFSDFLMDPVSGNFGGEIRLGYESDGNETHPVVGGSLSANFAQVSQNMKFSKETRQINEWIVPCAVLLTDVVLAGE